MNWLQKIAKTIDTKHIPSQISAAISAMLGKGEWRVARNARRDWTAFNEHRAVFDTVILGTDIKENPFSNKSYEVSVYVRYTLPFNEDPENNPTRYDSKLGLQGIDFQPNIRIMRYQHDLRDIIKDREWGPMLEAPHEVASWVVAQINGESSGFDSDDGNNGNNNDDDGGYKDEPDLFPQWPYPEEVVDEEVMAILPGQRR